MRLRRILISAIANTIANEYDAVRICLGTFQPQSPDSLIHWLPLGSWCNGECESAQVPLMLGKEGCRPEPRRILLVRWLWKLECKGSG